MRLAVTVEGGEHAVTVPRHRAINVGTLSAIVADVARITARDRDDLAEELFRR